MSSLLLRSQFLVLEIFSSLSASIKRVCTQVRYRLSDLTDSQFNNSVNVLLICRLTSFSFISSSSISPRMLSSITVGNDDLLVVMAGRWGRDVGMLPERWWWRMTFGGEDGKDMSSSELGEEDREGFRWRSGEEFDVAVGMAVEMWLRCFRRASCWEWRRRYFWRAKALSGDLWVGFILKVSYLAIRWFSKMVGRLRYFFNSFTIEA